MSTKTYRQLLIQICLLFLITCLVSCQSTTLIQKTDTVTKLVIRYMNANKPDSVYLLAGAELRKRMTLVMWTSYYKENLYGLLPLTNLTFITSSDSVNIYKVDGKIPLNCYVSLDNKGKINRFSFIPFQEELKQVSMNTSEQNTDKLAQKILNLINRKQADSVYLFAGNDFKSRVDKTRWRVFAESIFSVTPLPPAVFMRSDKGISVYGMKPYQFVFGAIDKDGKFNAFALKPYAESAVKPQKEPTDNKLVTHLDSVVDKVVSAYIQTKGNVGISTGVFYNGNTYFYNYGEHKRGSHSLPDNHTLYDIGSITKTFTSTLLAIAVNDGKLTLETSITKYLPDSVAQNPDLKNITFKELANHTSGFPRMPENYERTVTNVNQIYGNYTTNDMFSFLRHFKKTREHGTKFEYSNLAVGLMGLLLEKLYHKPYEELIRQYITSPLKMNETMFSVDTLKFNNLATGYNYLLEPTPFINLLALQAAGGIKSSTFDMLAYAKAQLYTSNTTLTAGIKLTHQITFNDGADVIGLNWVYLSNDQNVLFHDGGTIGYHSSISIDLSKQIAVVALTNNVSTGDWVSVAIMKAIQTNKN